MKLSELLPHLLWANSSEHDLIKAVEELSENFTKDRSKISTYLSDPRLVSAYTAFYLSTNVPKLEAVLKWLKPSELEELEDYELIDVGAGPGTFSLAWRELIGTKSVMIETSSVMREQAKKLFQGLYQEEALFDLKQIMKKKLLLFGHSLNEMGLEAGLEYLQKTNPDKVWMIEPGTKEMFQLALKFREKMLKLGWSIRFPCPSSSSCPMEGSDDWCHQYLNVRHSDDVERLTQLAGRDRRNLPITVMMFEKNEMKKEESTARIVRVFPQTKFSHEWQVCLKSHDQLMLQRFELPFKLNSKAEKKAIESLLAGDEIHFEIEKDLSERKRVRLKL